MGLPESSLVELRNEAIACMALPDLRLGKVSLPWPPGTRAIGFDACYQRYAQVDAEGGVLVAMAHGGEVVRIKSNGTIDRRIKIAL